MNKREFGKAGELLAAEYLKQNGYWILDRNFWCKQGELDLVAQKGECVHFIEVKTRSGDYYGMPRESITPQKLNRMRLVAEYYMKVKAATSLVGREMQIDVIEVSINHIENI